jgi:penicillin-binding protein 2
MKRYYRARFKFIFVLILSLFGFYLAYFWYLQLIKGGYFRELSQYNYLHRLPIRAPRGEIVDRYGRLLAENRPSYNIALFRHRRLLSSGEVARLSRELNISRSSLLPRLARYRNAPLFIPVVVEEDASLEKISYLEARKHLVPELIVDIEPKRAYSYGEYLSPVLGYVGEISSSQLKAGFFSRAGFGDLVGQAGIERYYNRYLMGENGVLGQKVDSRGALVETLYQKEPKPGARLILTVDAELTRYIHRLYQGRKGAAVVLSPRTGEVLALITNPSYDPGVFSSRFSSARWQKLANDPDHPLHNRAVQGVYPPGSAFKLIIALAALDAGAVTENTKVLCSGVLYVNNHPFYCHKQGGHGSISFHRGIVYSCNVYFYELGLKLGIDRIADYARQFGFGRKVGIDLPFESAGLIPDPAYKRRLFNEPWFPGETASVAIGQGGITVTPLQLALFTSALANGGEIVRPHLLRRVISPDGEPVLTVRPEKVGGLGVSPEAISALARAMRGVVEEGGTGWRAKISGIEIAGKTGTAQVVAYKPGMDRESLPKPIREHSWFTCFAPYDDPEVVVTVLVEHGGMGGVTAAPMARKILEFYFREKERRLKLAIAGGDEEER